MLVMRRCLTLLVQFRRYSFVRQSTSYTRVQSFKTFNLENQLETILAPRKTEKLKSNSKSLDGLNLPRSLLAQLKSTQDPHLRLATLLEYHDPTRISPLTFERILSILFSIENSYIEGFNQLSSKMILEIIQFFILHYEYRRIAQIFIYIICEFQLDLRTTDLIAKTITRALKSQNDLDIGLLDILRFIYMELYFSEDLDSFMFYFKSLTQFSEQYNTSSYELFLENLEKEDSEYKNMNNLLDKIEFDLVQNNFQGDLYLQVIDNHKLYLNGMIIRLVKLLPDSKVDNIKCDEFLNKLIYNFKRSNVMIQLNSVTLLKLSKLMTNPSMLHTICTDPLQSAQLKNYYLKKSLRPNGSLSKSLKILKGSNLKDLNISLIVETLLRTLNTKTFRYVLSTFPNRSLLVDMLIIKSSESQKEWILKSCNYSLSNNNFVKLIPYLSSLKRDRLVNLLEKILKHSQIDLKVYFIILKKLRSEYFLKLLSLPINSKELSNEEKRIFSNYLLKNLQPSESMKLVIDEIQNESRKKEIINFIFKKILSIDYLKAETFLQLYPSLLNKEKLFAYKISHGKQLEGPGIPGSLTNFNIVWNRLSESPEKLNRATVSRISKIHTHYTKKLIILKILKNCLSFMKTHNNVNFQNRRFLWCISKTQELKIPPKVIKQIIDDTLYK
ncbi:hypothetical protein WICMUC_003916 [Wickerhamomyces mucosus]|uniref:Uncharacterized protein n=1 Tax=Wickerhamomyces mucosus TaxID=1378264 RepID=A0A9P8TB55_9ASCO|nr:hypothetical protein WICMUC_003916 [Wickerhamomyces mucosus]